MHAIYERITVAGPEILGVRLTAAAYAHGLALALPDKVVLARREDSNLRMPYIPMPPKGAGDRLTSSESA